MKYSSRNLHINSTERFRSGSIVNFLIFDFSQSDLSERLWCFLSENAQRGLSKALRAQGVHSLSNVSVINPLSIFSCNKYIKYSYFVIFLIGEADYLL